MGCHSRVPWLISCLPCRSCWISATRWACLTPSPRWRWPPACASCTAWCSWTPLWHPTSQSPCQQVSSLPGPVHPQPHWFRHPQLRWSCNPQPRWSHVSPARACSLLADMEQGVGTLGTSPALKTCCHCRRGLRTCCLQGAACLGPSVSVHSAASHGPSSQLPACLPADKSHAFCKR